MFCVAVAAVAAYQSYSSPSAKFHGYTWKYALQTVETVASADHATVLICSDLPEADSSPMPDDPKDSVMFSPLTYYKLSVPVVPLPRTLTPDAQRIGDKFLQEAEQRRQPFLVMGYIASYPTLRWLSARAAPAFSSREVAEPEGVVILEFTPLDSTGASE
jgi:hypothetical protein